ncbi:nitrogenase component 1 [Methanoculleus sp.]|uniref:nitrogenase component 1 n=1 Tax=Methanoculleus sp. TaxID=90427 RepID=UPI00262F7092|nr:nitrogenase component 1 [Methanoculleus sp.]MDI6866616.1 nitrogenase component 1 [Methanoculleus sp.]
MTGSAVKIPRATCKVFGAIKALSTVRGCVVLVHGPKGCVYHINYILGMRGDRPSEVYSTCLDEHDVIFGAEEKLREAIEELDAGLHPDLIAVLSCCVSSIIGEDLNAAARAASTSARVVGIEAGGFEGDFRDGYSETLCRLVEEFVRGPGEVGDRSVNLIGLLRGGPDLRELVRTLGLIGVRVNATLTANATVDDLERLGEAALNIVLCEPAGLEAAKLLERVCATPFIVADIPVGHAATIRFLDSVADALGVARYSGRDEGSDDLCREALAGRRVAIVSGPTRAIGVTRFLVDLGLAPSLIVVDFDPGNLERLSDLAGPECEILVEPEQELIQERLEAGRVDLILGGMLERPLAASLGIEHLDMMHGSQRTLGFAGAKHLVEALTREKPCHGGGCG